MVHLLPFLSYFAGSKNVSARPSARLADQGTMTNTTLEAIASSSGKNHSGPVSLCIRYSDTLQQVFFSKQLFIFSGQILTWLWHEITLKAADRYSARILRFQPFHSVATLHVQIASRNSWNRGCSIVIITGNVRTVKKIESEARGRMMLDGWFGVEMGFKDV